MADAPYELYYWPTIQGRGEFVRLALEDRGESYVDVARLPKSQGGGAAAIMKFLHGKSEALQPFAPPFLKVGELVIAQTANILAYLGPQLGLVPTDEAGRLEANQLTLTIADLVSETHDTHHPISSSLFYEDQKAEARRRAAIFTRERLPKFLSYFERILKKQGGEHLVGSDVSYVDLCFFQVLSGLDYAFPEVMKVLAATIPLSIALRDRVAARPKLAKYLASSRRLPFSEDDLFRHYQELDVASS